MVREMHAFSDDGSMEVPEYRVSSDFENVTYDEPFKNVFSIKRILAVIIKETIDLYFDCSVDDVVRLIESIDPAATVKSDNDDKITISESYVKGEGTVKFDLLMKVGVPADKVAEVGNRYVQVKLDLEMQRNSTPNYPLSYRGLYYGSRLVSDQIPKINQDTNYGILMPVYSVWITLVGKNTDAANKVLRYSLVDVNYNQAVSSGSFVGRMNAVTDLLNIYFICIDKSILENKMAEDDLEPVIEYVSLLFAGQFYDDRLMEHDIKFDTVMDKYGEELKTMSGYYSEVEEIVECEAEAARADGIAIGRAYGEMNIIKNLLLNGMSEEEIEKFADVTKEKIEGAKEMLCHVRPPKDSE